MKTPAFIRHYRLSLALLLIIAGSLLSTNQTVLALIGGHAVGGGFQSNAGFAVRQPASVNNGLVAYYPLDGNANDTSGNGNNGRLVGSPVYASGKFGNAFTSVGTNSQYINIPNSGSFQFGSSSFAMVAWVNIAVAGRANRIIAIGSAASAILTFDVSSTNMFTYFSDGTNNVNGGPSVNISINQWHQVGLIIDRSLNKAIFYLDGVIQATQPSISTIGAFNPTGITQLGISTSSGPYGSLNGSLDDVRIYNRAISAAEVTTLYQGSSPENCDSSCVGYWKLDETSGTTAKAQVSNPNGNNATLAGFTFDGTTNGWLGFMAIHYDFTMAIATM